MAEHRLCVVDGTYELFRAYFGAPSRRSPAGVEIGATVALGRSLRNLADSGEFSHLAVAFDTTIESFRNTLFAGYKTGEGIEPELFAQFPLAERMAEASGLCVLRMVEFEADDALASAAAQFLDRTSGVVIASPDKDLMQCVRPGVTTWDRLRQKTYDEAGVVEKLGVLPRLVPDYLALVGDTADGIPGVPKWGAKSAATALSHFGGLEMIPREVAAWDIKMRGLPALLEQLKGHEKEVLLYRTLATLRTDVDLQVTFEEMEYRGAHEEALASLSEELGLALPG
jgi:5'-3' exonuclease